MSVGRFFGDGMLRRFRASDDGNIAIILAFGLFTILTAVGAVIDYSRMSAVHSDLQSALDSGVLAAASSAEETREARRAHGLEVVSDNLALAGITAAEFDIAVDADGVVSGTAGVTYDFLIMQIVGVDSSKIEVVSQGVSEETMRDAEIVLVLDYSSSMNAHYEAMRDAAVALVSELAMEDEADIRLGLVPFAGEVFMSLDGRYAVDGSPGTNWEGCTLSRKWPFVVRDQTPTGSDRSKWGESGDDCDEYLSRGLSVLPLTEDAAQVTAQLQDMVPFQGTNTSLGVEVGYQLLSPRLPFPASEFAGGMDKFLVVLSDGELTRPSYGPGNRFTLDQAASNLQTICDTAAANGVAVVTVLYETTDLNARSAMQNCASAPGLFLVADEGNIGDRLGMITNLVKADTRLTR